MEAMGHVFISGALPENLEHNIYFYLFIFFWSGEPNHFIEGLGEGSKG